MPLYITLLGDENKSDTTLKCNFSKPFPIKKGLSKMTVTGVTLTPKNLRQDNSFEIIDKDNIYVDGKLVHPADGLYENGDSLARAMEAAKAVEGDSNDPATDGGIQMTMGSVGGVFTIIKYLQPPTTADLTTWLVDGAPVVTNLGSYTGNATEDCAVWSQELTGNNTFYLRAVLSTADAGGVGFIGLVTQSIDFDYTGPVQVGFKDSYGVIGPGGIEIPFDVDFGVPQD